MTKEQHAKADLLRKEEQALIDHKSTIESIQKDFSSKPVNSHYGSENLPLVFYRLGVTYALDSALLPISKESFISLYIMNIDKRLAQIEEEFNNL